MSPNRDHHPASPSDGRRPGQPAIREFLRTEAGSGLLLLGATVAALAWANSPWSGSYRGFWHTEVGVGPESWRLHQSVRHWVNDALMVGFFFLIGLEIKREAVAGELRSVSAAALPALGALGGMVVPALIFVALAGGGAAGHGWGIPMATDIAFAVGVLALLGNRVPGGLKVFLLTLAVIDDIGAILVIAVFYSSGIGLVWLAAAAVLVVVVVALKRVGASSPLVYLPVGVVVWYCTFRAGVHPTIAGVALGVLAPMRTHDGRPVLDGLERRIHPVSSFVIVPLFALANAGVFFGGGALGDALSSRLAWAVFAGLVVGKVVGISAATLGGQRARLGILPSGVAGGHVLGAGALGGIGFTVALFIAGLAFQDPDLQAEAKIGVLAASVVAGLLGAGLLAALRDPAGEDRDIPSDGEALASGDGRGGTTPVLRQAGKIVGEGE